MAIITPPDLHQCAFLLHDLAYNARKFLDAASSVDDLNARRIFVELTRMPSPRTIRRYAGNELLRRWSSENPDPQINGGAISFYRVDRESGLVDMTVVHTAEDVKMDFFRCLTRVYKNVLRFKSCWGAKSLYDIAYDPDCSDNKKVSDIIDIRVAQKLPTLEPMGWTDEGVIVFGLKHADVDMSIRSENRIRLAAHLPLLSHCDT